MALSLTALTSGQDMVAGIAPRTTASFSVSARSLLLVSIAIADDGQNATPFMSGVTSSWGPPFLSWVAMQQRTTIDTFNNLYVFRTFSPSAQTGTLSLNASNVANTMAWSVVEVLGFKEQGLSQAAGAIQQAANSNADAVTSHTITLPAAITPGNATFGAILTTSTNAVSPGTGYTEIHESNNAGPPVTHLETEWRLDGQTAVDWSFGSSNVAAIAFEINESPPYPGGDLLIPRL